VSQNLTAEAYEVRVGTVTLQQACAMDKSPDHARQKNWVALTDLTLLLGFANHLFQNSEIPASSYLCAAGFEQGGEHHLELRAMFVRKAGVAERHGIHLRRKTLSCRLSIRLHYLAELDKAGFAYGGKQGGFILEVPVRRRPRNTQAVTDLPQRERVKPFALN
jgi:hypothetical protein